VSEDLRAEVAALAARVRELEDREEIAQLATRYGPAVDFGEPAAAAALWTADGVYAAPPYAVWTGREEIAGMVAGGHQDLIRAGAGHVLTPLHVELDGDEADVTSYVDWSGLSEERRARSAGRTPLIPESTIAATLERLEAVVTGG
jgi:hypothetical protein